MTSEQTQSQPTEEQIERWFKRRFGDEFTPTAEQKAWVRDNWGRENVPKEEWEAVLPPIEKELDGIKYVLEHGHYGGWTSEEALTLKEWADKLPPDPNEPELSKRATQDEKAVTEFQNELAKELVIAKDIVPPEWLIEGMLPKNTLNFIGGDAGIGKTLLALQMAACLMKGQPFLGHPTNKTNVLLIERDEPLHLLKAKIDKQAVKYPELKDLEIYKGAIRVDHNPDKLKLLVHYKKPDVVFIDSFSAIHYKDENSAMDMRPVLDCLRDVAMVYGVTVICIHHFGRTYEPKKKGHLRGSTVIEAQSDFAIGVDKSDSQLLLRPLKARGVFEPIKLVFDKETLTYEKSGSLTQATKKLARQQRIRELRQDNVGYDEIYDIIMKEFQVSWKTVSRDLKKVGE